MSTLTIRIDDKLKKNASKLAEHLGLSLSFIIKNALKNFVKEPRIMIGEPEEVVVTSGLQKKMNQIAKKLKEI